MLRALLTTAVEHSPWHRRRLDGINVGSLSARDIVDLPVMTKSDLMDNFDSIATDSRLSREGCEEHLLQRAGDHLLGEFQIVASGGSSGRRGIFVYGWEAWAICYSSNVRFQVRDWQHDPTLAGVPRVIAVVAASSPTHISAALSKTFASGDNARHLFPVSLPLEQIVAGLNGLQPTVLMGYSSFLPRLALEAQSGRLQISPRRVIAISEPLLPKARKTIDSTWRAPIANGYAMSEGVFTGCCGHSIHLPDDLCIFEPIDAHGQPVGPGVLSHRVLVTNLYNHTQPLIRYEVTDQVTLIDGHLSVPVELATNRGPTGSPRRHVRVRERADRPSAPVPLGARRTYRDPRIPGSTDPTWRDDRRRQHGDRQPARPPGEIDCCARGARPYQSARAHHHRRRSPAAGERQAEEIRATPGLNRILDRTGRRSPWVLSRYEKGTAPMPLRVKRATVPGPVDRDDGDGRS